MRAKGIHLRNSLWIGLLNIPTRRVQQQRYVGFLINLFKKNRIENHRIPFLVAIKVLDEYFIHQAALARPAVVIAHV